MEASGSIEVLRVDTKIKYIYYTYAVTSTMPQGFRIRAQTEKGPFFQKEVYANPNPVLNRIITSRFNKEDTNMVFFIVPF